MGPTIDSRPRYSAWFGRQVWCMGFSHDGGPPAKQDTAALAIAEEAAHESDPARREQLIQEGAGQN